MNQGGETQLWVVPKQSLGGKWRSQVQLGNGGVKRDALSLSRYGLGLYGIWTAGGDYIYTRLALRSQRAGRAGKMVPSWSGKSRNN